MRISPSPDSLSGRGEGSAKDKIRALEYRRRKLWEDLEAKRAKVADLHQKVVRATAAGDTQVVVKLRHRRTALKNEAADLEEALELLEAEIKALVPDAREEEFAELEDEFRVAFDVAAARLEAVAESLGDAIAAVESYWGAYGDAIDLSQQLLDLEQVLRNEHGRSPDKQVNRSSVDQRLHGQLPRPLRQAVEALGDYADQLVRQQGAA